MLVACMYIIIVYTICFIYDSVKMNWDDYIDNLIALTKDDKGVVHCIVIGLVYHWNRWWKSTDHPGSS